jgi:hypothetical protein
VTVEQADQYFQTHLETETWSAATPEQKAGALATAEAEIKSLPLRPNADPERIQKAIFEQAVFRLKVDSKRENLQAQGVKSAGIAYGPQETYGTLVYGIVLAPRAKLFLTGCFGVGVIR